MTGVSGVLVYKRPSLWRETFRAYVPHVNDEWRWTLAFLLTMLILNIGFYTDPFPPDVLAQLRKQGLTPEQKEVLKSQLFPFNSSAFLYLLELVLLVVSTYLFNVLFLRRIIKASPPTISFGNFFYWFRKAIKKTLVMILPTVVVAIVALISMEFFSNTNDSKQASDVLFVVVFVFLLLIFKISADLFQIFLSFRLYLVTPLAILRKDAVLKRSWRLTLFSLLRIILGNQREACCFAS